MTTQTALPTALLSAGTLWRTESVDHPSILSDAASPFEVSFGQLTFDAEGTEESGRYFSRRIGYPGGSGSGVTIGRGYDMGRRTSKQVLNELTLAGVPQDDARQLAAAAGLRGVAAQSFVRTNRHSAPVISALAQKQLFEGVVTPQIIGDIKRIFLAPNTTTQYGAASWEGLSRGAQELLFDLRFRGDYTPTTRHRVQPLVVKQDYEALRALMNDTQYWSVLGVPANRIKARQEMAALL